MAQRTHDADTIESALIALPGIVEARVLAASSCGVLDGARALRIGYVAGPGACHAAAEAHGLDAIVAVNRLGSDAELAALPVWTRPARDRLAAELSAELNVDGVAVVALRDGARRRPCRSRLVPEPELELDAVVRSDAPPRSGRTELGLVVSDRPALAVGRPLRCPDGYPTTLGEAFARTATTDRGVVFCAADPAGSHRERYASLHRRALGVLGGLRAAGVSPGDIVLVDSSPAGDFLAAMWACVLGGIVFAPIAVPPAGSDPTASARLRAAWELLGHPALLSRGVAPPTMVALDVRALAAAPPGNPSPARDPADTAIIVLTSGSTGVPKGVHQSHAAILGMVQAAVVSGLDAGAGDVVFNWMPLDHAGAVFLLTLAATVLGCEQVQAETTAILAAPARWGDLVSAHRVSVTWAPNFAYALIASAVAGAPRSWDLSCLKAIVNGGEAVAETVAHELVQRLGPYGIAGKQVVVPSFGMSETCSGITLGALDRGRGPFSNLGPPVDGSALRIVDDHDRVVKEGEIGRLEIAGPQLFTRYHGQPELDRSAWFDTGDVGFLADGQLHLTGRRNDRINVNGTSWFAAEIEAAVMAIPGVDRACVAAAAVRPPGAATDQVAVFFGILPETGLDDDGVVLALTSAIRTRAMRQLALTIDHLVPLAGAAFRRTSTGKIRRRALAETFEAGGHAAIDERVRGLCGGRNTCDLPLHRRSWVPRRPVARRDAPSTAWLVFTRDQAMVRQLGSSARPRLQVVRAARTERLDDVTWALAPDDLAGHTAVLDSLTTGPGATIVHAWGCEPGDAACTSLRTLARAIAARPEGARPSAVVAVATGSVSAGPADRVDPDHALVPGLCRSLGRELPDVRWHSVDLTAPDRLGERVTCELAEAAEPLVAWRNDQRLVARFEAVTLATPTPSDRPVVAGDLWLVTGGLGGLGQASAAWLLGRGARVLLVGRTERHQLSAERALALRRLATLGDVHYAALDVGDGDSLTRAIEAEERAIGRPLAGALHMAGLGRAVALADDDGADLGAMRRATLGGLACLAQIGKTRPSLRLLIAGSITGQVGGRVMGYAAVHAALAEAAGALIAAGAAVSYLAFSSWSGTGLSAGQTSEAQVRADGLVPLDVTTGLCAIEAALWRPGAMWLVGLDDGHPAHAAFASATLAPLTRPIAWIQGGDAHEPRGAVVRPDALGRPGWVLVRQAAEIPRDRTGQPDLVRLQAEHTTRRVDPRDESERRVAEVFSEVLAIALPGIHDDFFLVGGSSLLAARLAARLSAVFFVELPAASVFQNPTVAALTGQLRMRESQRGMTDAVARHLASLRAAAGDLVPGLAPPPAGARPAT